MPEFDPLVRAPNISSVADPFAALGNLPNVFRHAQIDQSKVDALNQLKNVQLIDPATGQVNQNAFGALAQILASSGDPAGGSNLLQQQQQQQQFLRNQQLLSGDTSGAAPGAATSGAAVPAGQGSYGQMTADKQQVASIITDEWGKAGMPNVGVSGVLPNVGEESGFNPTLRHADQPRWGGEAHFAHGLYQEGGAEWNRYSEWLRQNYPGADWRDPRLQSRFAAWNLKTNYPGVWKRMAEAKTPEDAAETYVRGYLKPAAQFQTRRILGFRAHGVPLVSEFARGPISGPEAGTQEDPFRISAGEVERVPEGKYYLPKAAPAGTEPILQTADVASRRRTAAAPARAGARPADQSERYPPVSAAAGERITPPSAAAVTPAAPAAPAPAGGGYTMGWGGPQAGPQMAGGPAPPAGPAGAAAAAPAPTPAAPPAAAGPPAPNVVRTTPQTAPIAALMPGGTSLGPGAAPAPAPAARPAPAPSVTQPRGASPAAPAPSAAGAQPGQSITGGQPLVPPEPTPGFAPDQWQRAVQAYELAAANPNTSSQEALAFRQKAQRVRDAHGLREVDGMIINAENGRVIYEKPVNVGGQLMKPSTGEVLYSGSGLFDKDEAHLVAMRVWMGDTTAWQGLGYGRQRAENIKLINQELKTIGKEQGLNTDSEVARAIANSTAEFQGRKQEQRTLGAQEARMGAAGFEARNAIDFARGQIERVPRTAWLPMNKLLEKWQKGTLNPEQADLLARTQAVRNAYSAVMARGALVTTDAARARADELLATASDAAVYNRVLDVMEQEIDRAINSPEQMREFYRNKYGVKSLGQATAAPGDAAGAGGTRGAQPSAHDREVGKRSPELRQRFIDHFGVEP